MLRIVFALTQIAAIKWLKNGQEFVPDGSRVKAFLNDDGSFGLIFEATEAADKGTYTAVAVNDGNLAAVTPAVSELLGKLLQGSFAEGEAPPVSRDEAAGSGD